jgi:hypothetical protein
MIINAINKLAATRWLAKVRTKPFIQQPQPAAQ